MSNCRILIVGSGNTTGINVIKALMGVYQVIGTDCNELNAANKFCKNYTVPRAGSPNYIGKILEIAEKHKITHIISTNDHDTRALFLKHDVFVERNIHHNGFCLNAVSLLDKDATYSLFIENNIDTPVKLNERRVPFVLRKKEMGNKSKFVYIVKDKTDMNIISEEAFNDGIMTEYIEGPEFTVDVLCDNKGDALCVIPRQRLEVRGGMVWHGKTIYDKELIEYVKEISKKLQLSGVMCLQCIKRASGGYAFIEINPRVGSGIDLSVNAGCNLLEMWVQLTMGERLNITLPQWDTEMIRYNSAYFFHGNSGNSI